VRLTWKLLLGAGLILGAGCALTTDVGDVEAKIYARVKTDVAYDTAVTNGNGNFVQYVRDDTTGDDKLNVTARETRLGVKFKSMDESVTGKAEVDFYGGTVSGAGLDSLGGTVNVTSTTPENKPTVLLRHLFVKMKLSDACSLLAGQTSDVFSPLLPAVVNYGWGWNAGNPGYRRPQVRIECTKGGLVVQAAAARSINGEESASADWQARVGYGMKDAMGKSKLSVGISGVKGLTDNARDDSVEGAGLDFHVALGSKLFLRGEAFTGRNLATYLGGIAQGLNANGREIGTRGGWAQLGVKLAEKHTLNVGYGVDDPKNEDLDTAGRKRNHFAFLNIRCKLNDKTETVLEASGWETEYVGGEDYDNTRIQASLIFTF
jgi:hypothetical protein